jgi:5-methyltetrahydropteroyltriglutamate--homocysteine methyltransferase
MTHYRADQLGSFLRPQALLDARLAYDRGELPLSELRNIEDREILRALDQQRRAGVDVYCDGEFRRSGFVGPLTEITAGLSARNDPAALQWTGTKEGGSAAAPGAVRPRAARLEDLRSAPRMTAHEAAFLKARAPGPFKITVPSPVQGTRLLNPDDRPGDSDRDALVREVTALVQREIRALIDDRVPYIQLDAPRYAYYLDPELRARLVAAGLDPEAELDEALAADNACIGQPHPPEVTTGFHVCRGNNRSQWFAEGGYDDMAEKLFNRLDIDAFLLEYDSDRSGSFEPLRFVPPGKTVGLGLVTTKTPELESQDALLRRIDEAARYVPIENLALSPQCGFASLLLGHLLTIDQQWRKLELVVDTARKVWG